MPTYEFRCPQGHEFEKFYRTIGGAEAQSACPQCGQLSGRMMSATGFAFKGSGFYLTDYGKNAHRDKGTPAPASGGGEGGKVEGSKGDGGGAGDSASKGEGAGQGDGGSKGDASGSAPAASPGPESSKPAAPAASKPAAAPPPKKGASE
jgi:putative FmdB family regulatory protein